MGVAGVAGVCSAGAAFPVPSVGVSPGNRYVAYRSFLKQPEMTRAFAGLGVTTRCFFAANTVNSAGNPYCEYPPMWKGTNAFDFAAFDAQTDDLLKASPSADFLCIVDLNTPTWGVRHFWADSFHDITHVGVRDEWYRVTTHWLTNFLVHAQTRCGARIRGYILSGGGTSEWYEINQGKRSRWKDEAWRRWCVARGKDHGAGCPSDAALSTAAFEGVVYDPAVESEKIDYWRFHNSIPANAVLAFARAARAALPPSTEIGVFFGYALESHDLQASFGHLDYERVFASPDIDFVISPGNYSDRDIGGGSGSQLPHGTARRYGKRLLHEIDFAPHGSPLWATPWQSAADDLAGNTREAAFALANGLSYWWFDMWGGFYEDAALRARIARLTEISRTVGAYPAEPVADVLLVCDPQSACYVNEQIDRAPRPTNAPTPNAALRFRNALTRSGAVCDVVSFNDLAAIDLSRYRLVCLPQTVEITPARAEILRARVCTRGRTVVWGRMAGLSDGATLDVRRVRDWTGVDYATPGVSVTEMPGGWRAVYAADVAAYTPQVLKDITRQAGCWVCLDECAGVFANRRFLAVHVKDGGRKTLRLRERAAEVTDLLTGEVVARDVSEVAVTFTSPETRLFGLMPAQRDNTDDNKDKE